MPEQQSAPKFHLPKAEDFLLWPPNVQAYGYRIVDKLFASCPVPRSTTSRPLLYGRNLDISYRCASGKFTANDLMDRNALSGLLILKDGMVVREQYGLGLQPSDRWSTMSMVKSITATLVGIALFEGRLRSLDDAVIDYVPELADSLCQDVTIRHLLTMSSGVAWNEDYADKNSDVNRYSKSLADGVPGGVFALLKSLRRAYPPGAHWHYNTGDTFLLGAALRNAVDMPLARYLSEKIWQPCGMEFDAFYTLEAPGGLEIGGSRAGIALRDLGRFAKFVLDDGIVDGVRFLPQGWNDAANTAFHAFTPSEMQTMSYLASDGLTGYGYSWWIAEDGAMVALGFAGQRIYINRAEKLSIITLGAYPSPQFQGPGDHDRAAEAVAFTQAVKTALAS